MAAPQLYFQPGGLAERVMQRCPELKAPFHPSIWAPDPHSQSAMGMLRTLTARGSYTRQLVMASDGGTLGLDWWCGSDRCSWAAADAPIVLFIHGINGGSHEGYVKWACVAAASRGWRAVVLNMRGCNGLPLTSARGYNAINTVDVHVAVQSIHSRFPEAPLMAAGYSLGSVLLAKYLAEADNGLYARHSSSSGSSDGPAGRQQQGGGGGSVPEPGQGSGLVAAALVSPPVCLHSTNAKMGRPTSFKFLYNLLVAYKLREYVREHMATIHASGMNIDTDAMLNGWTVASFDDAVTLKALGYASPHFYYRHACSTNYIPHIRTPTLILLSKDDPFLGVVPQEQVQRNPFTLMAATRRGGHLAFLQGWWPLGASYCDSVIDGWLSTALQEWRHGTQEEEGAAAGVLGGAALAAPPIAHAPAPAGSGPRAWQQQQQQQQQGRPEGRRLPSWVERAVAAGLVDPRQRFDPTTLAEVLCSCSPEEHPVAQAHAVDAALNTAAAPVALAADAVGKAAAAATATGRAAGAGSGGGRRRSGGGGGGAKHSWTFGFGRSAAATTPGSSMPGLRESGAWAPFGDAADEAGGAGAGGGSSAQGGAAGAGRGGWWGGRISGSRAAAPSGAAGPAVEPAGAQLSGHAGALAAAGPSVSGLRSKL